MSTDKDARRRELKVGGIGLAIGGLSFGLESLPIHDNPEVVDVLGNVSGWGYTGSGLLLGGAIAHNRWYNMAHKRLERVLGEDGWLNRYDLKTSAGASAMRKQAQFLRPDLAARPDGSRLRRHPVTECATHVGKAVSGPRRMRGCDVYSPHSRGTLVLGPQGSGKSSWLAHKVFDFPGGAYVSTTKPELAVMAAAARAERGPVHIFNPSNFGGLGSSLAWDPVQGCQDQGVADARAWALVRGGGGAAGVERADFWAQKAAEIIRCYLMAAALANYDMGAVHHWAVNPDDMTPMAILEAHPNRAPTAWIGTFKTHLGASHNTRTGYFATVVSCVGFLDNPTVAAACRPGPSQNFDILKFLHSGALFVIAGEDNKRLAPLLTALTEHIFSQAKVVASTCRGGRLPNGLAMILDEVAQTTPVPLDKWAADSRGWGIDVTAVVQDLAQLRTTWGPDRAKTIYGNLPTKVVLPGVAAKDDLEELAYLAGKRVVEKISEGESVQDGGLMARRSVSTNRHSVYEPVISGESIYGLPMWHAYVLGLAPRPVVVKFEPGYQRAKREHRKLSKAARQFALPQLPEHGGPFPAGAAA